MKNAKMLLFPLGGIVLMVAVALVLTWVTATPDEKNLIADWIEDYIGQEQDEDVRQIDWASLPDEVVAWVEVPGTEIDEPIVQANPGYPNYWLYADVFGEGGHGTPYIDCDCSLDGPFTIVYGHHMDDGSVFAGFASYSDAAFAEDHRTVYLYVRQDDSRRELKVVAVNVLNASNDSLQTEFKDQRAFKDYALSCFEESEVVLGSHEDISRLYAFATCSYETWNSRTVVYAE
ncbi:class B sortase [uncultured Olsenella sp.]|uniref:class B sortase n=1 Tax=uncultured Olsenella sp. TaxID=190764 RepID=UPI0026DBD6D1|nr:class B sortase [uncultured Olsenella sp.]